MRERKRPPMDYEGRIYRPPSEARSLLLQVTVGCSHNRCAYCDMYRDKTFRAKPWRRIQADLAEAGAACAALARGVPGSSPSLTSQPGQLFRRVFLCDGDALILSTTRLLRILEEIRRRLPWVERVGVYGDTRSAGRKSVAELRELRDAGLGIVYHGMESGDDEVLRRIDKGGTRAGCIETARRLREAGLLHSVIVLLGIGGRERSAAHARNTASALTEMDPPYVGALTTTVLPGTPLAGLERRGAFRLPEKFTMLAELRAIVAGSTFTRCRFSANHASNYLSVRAVLPRDKAALLDRLDRVLEARDEGLLRPESLRGL